MKKKLYSFIVCGIISSILGLFLAYGTQIGFLNIISSLTKPELAIEIAEPRMIGFKAEDGRLTSQTDDSYLVYHDINAYVNQVQISLKTVDQPVEIKIYYANGGEFSEEQSIQKIITNKNNTKLNFLINSYITDLRIDLGSATGQVFELESVELEKPKILFSKETLTLALLITLVFIFLFAHFIVGPTVLYNTIDRYRYWIAAVVVAFAVIFELSGSSLASWKDYIYMDNDGVLAGIARPIRSDEWAVNTPMTMSQYYNGYSAVSNIIRGTLTDVSIVYGQPALSLNLLFRIFSVGYVLLGTSYGLAFFWYARLVVLFLVTYEFVKLITKGNKPYALLGSILITFSPIVQWWFAINGLVEMLIATQLSILLLDKYIKTDSSKKRALYFVLILLCAGNFILTFYPSWMIPVAYVILGFILWIFIENWSTLTLKKIDIFNIVWMTVVFAAVIGYIFSASIDTINSVMNTVYPGSRVEVGGGSELENLVGAFSNIFFPFRKYLDIHNTSEMAVFLDMFPLGIILSLFYMFKTKKKDSLMIILIALSVFFFIWMSVGYPEIIAKFTFLDKTQARRTYLGFGLVNTFLLLRVLSVMELKIRPIWGLLAAGLYAMVMAVINRQLYPILLHHPLAVMAVFFLAFGMSSLVICWNRKPQLVAAFIGSIVLVSGLSVNPIQQSTDAIEKSKIADSLKEIQKEEEGVWIVEGMGLPMNNLPIMFGLPTINSTNVYPNLELWETIDTEKQYEEVYNRYAHIVINVVGADNPADGSFELVQADVFTVNLSLQKLKNMDVKYILSQNDLSLIPEFKDGTDHLYISDEGYRVYKILE
ncbi:YfhO family protein [Enterococcus sp. CWB-B31]|uniref:YfhO family protein n=1 Tax=Enterococcus sp. CWB-B31 TaxID=2885159 RepID=UPI001E497F90|nr:YfhO family protein [Enterococcus sp. CWB-B31]MCB5956214.1 YfhO family protein [Enterococcus sp. CWB-B31]